MKELVIYTSEGNDGVIRISLNPLAIPTRTKFNFRVVYYYADADSWYPSCRGKDYWRDQSKARRIFDINSSVDSAIKWLIDE